MLTDGPEHGGEVVDINGVIDDEDIFGPGHLPGAPDAVHDGAGVEGVVFGDLDVGDIVECAVHGEVVVFDVGENGLQEGAHDAFGGFAQEVVLLRGEPDDGGWVDGVGAVGEGGDFDDWIAIGHGVEPGVVAEGAFEDGTFAEFACIGLSWVPAGESCVGADEAFDDHLGVGGDPEGDGFGPAEFDALAVEKAGYEEFGDARGERAGGGVGQDGWASECDGDGHGLPELFP